MRLHIPSLLVACTAFLATAADTPNLSGKWQIQRSAAGRESKQECTFTQTGNELTGSCDAANGEVWITGTVDGKKVTWTYKSDSEGGPVTVVYKGNLDSTTKITGIVSAIEFSIDGEFTATQSN